MSTITNWTTIHTEHLNRLENSPINNLQGRKT